MEETEKSSQSHRTCHCGWSSVTTYQGLRIHQGKKGCTPQGTRIPENTDSKVSSMDDMAHSMAQLEVKGNAQTPSASPEPLQQSSELLASVSSEEEETRARQKKLTEVKSLLKDYTEHLAAEGLERHQVFTEVMKIVEDTLQRELKWRYVPPLPSIMMGNVNSLVNKMVELAGLVRTQLVFRESSVLCFTETWLREDIPDSEVTLGGFHTVRADRSYYDGGETRGGGLAILINNKWCDPGHVTMEKHVCTPDIELLAVSLRPYYLPREFSHVIILAVEIPQTAQEMTVCDVIHGVVAELQTAHPDAFIAISGRFNHVTLDDTLPTFTQFVDCPTSNDETLDLLYANAKEAYRCIKLPPLGESDHNLIHLQPL